jgi:hypothetical protein
MLLFFAVGCVGDIGDSQTPGDDDGGGSNTPSRGRSTFKSDVHPALGKCSGGACHDTTGTSGTLSRFYNVDPDTSYNATVQLPLLVGQFSSIAPILSHIAAGHKAVMYSPDEQTKITNWLAIEAMERAGGGGGSNQPPPPDPKVLLREWSGCMDLADFTTAKMPTAWGNLSGGTGQKCVNCHGTGLGVVISADPNLFFNSMSQQSFFMLKFFAVDTQANKMIVNTSSFTNASTMANHPTFDPLNNPGMLALKQFYDLTLAHKTGGTCGQPKLVE